MTRDHLIAVDNVGFTLYHGETLGLVGESGCGKSTLGRVILRLIEPTDGKVRFEGIDIFSLNKREMRALRKNMQIIFQDPYASLDPRMKIGNIVGEPIEIHGIAKGKEKRDMVEAILDRVGLRTDDICRYPHEFSGGQRQRIGIARAIILHPKLIVADEPVSSLDVSIQAQVINLLEDLQEEMGLSYLLISHDLSMVRHMTNRTAVMYLGKLVELSNTEEMFRYPLHPYTESLLSAIPIPDPKRKRKRIILKGEVPSPINPPSGCHFHPRCFLYERQKKDICINIVPELKEASGGHLVACHLRYGGEENN